MGAGRKAWGSRLLPSSLARGSSDIFSDAGTARRTGRVGLGPADLTGLYFSSTIRTQLRSAFAHVEIWTAAHYSVMWTTRHLFFRLARRQLPDWFLDWRISGPYGMGWAWEAS